MPRVHVINGMRIIDGGVRAGLCCVALGVTGMLRGAEEPAEVERLKADVSALAQDIGPRAVFRGDSLARAAAFIAARFESMGYSVRRQDIQSVKSCVRILKWSA